MTNWRCDITGNLVGTDTRIIGAEPCQCQGCCASRQIDELRATNCRLNRRYQEYERALSEKAKGQNSKSFGRAMLAWSCDQHQKEIERLRTALQRLEQIYCRDRVAATYANEIEDIFDKNLHAQEEE